MLTLHLEVGLSVFGPLNFVVIAVLSRIEDRRKLVLLRSAMEKFVELLHFMKLTKEEWEAVTGTDMSLILPSDGIIETDIESSLNDTGKEKSEGTIERTDTTSETQQPLTGKEKDVPVFQCRISSRQRKLSLDEYRKAFLQVPRIEDRKPVLVSGEVRDRLDKFVRRLGGRKMSVSGLLENIARQHLEIYSEDFEQWRKL